MEMRMFQADCRVRRQVSETETPGSAFGFNEVFNEGLKAGTSYLAVTIKPFCMWSVCRLTALFPVSLQ